MIYITGDTHGDFKRVAAFCDTVSSTLDDILIILGDVYCILNHGFTRDI